MDRKSEWQIRSMGSLVLKKLNKTFRGNIRAAGDIDLEITDGTFLVLVGPSGCGKTTILRMIAGLEEPSSGEIWLDGRLISDLAPKDRDMAMVFQNYALYPHKTVFENMAFSLRLRRTPKDEILERVRNTAALLGLEDLLDRKPGQLSGGQCQRVALGRAIIRKPRIFLMDEPLSNLDAALRVQMRTEILRLHQKLATTMIYVTHDQTEAMTMGTRIVVLRDGAIQQDDTPTNLYRKPRNLFVAGFIGIPPMNLHRGFPEEDSGSIYIRLEKHRIPVSVSDRDVQNLRNDPVRFVRMGIRAEDVRVMSGHTGLPGTIQGTVEVTENLGSELNVHFRTASGEFTVRTPADTEFKFGQEYDLWLNPDRIHLFDEETGVRIN